MVFDVERAELEVQMAARATGASAVRAWATALMREALEGDGESAEVALAEANVSAEEAMAARRHVPTPARQVAVSAQQRAPRALLDVEAAQQCRYRGMRCCGCGESFIVGETVSGAGGGFVHRRQSCQRAAEQALRSVTQPTGTDDDKAVDTTAAARAHSVWARLEREYALSEGRADAEAGGLLLPRHSRAAFLAFLEWMASDAERARSLMHVRLASRTFRAQTQLIDWCTDDEVASMLRRLGVQGVE